MANETMVEIKDLAEAPAKTAETVTETVAEKATENATAAKAAKRVTRVLARGSPSSQCTTLETFIATAVQACCRLVLARPI